MTSYVIFRKIHNYDFSINHIWMRKTFYKFRSLVSWKKIISLEERISENFLDLLTETNDHFRQREG